jgi:uncharacterized protein YxeA
MKKILIGLISLVFLAFIAFTLQPDQNLSQMDHIAHHHLRYH